MKPDELGLPTIIVPYPGPASEPGEQDIFVYLRPETNGVLAESTILKVVKAANGDQGTMKLIFLANYPGEFIVDHKIVEQYYSLKFHFAVVGKNAFTDGMKQRFTEWFKTPFEQADIIGSFRALEVLHKEPEELFATWVAEQEVCVINGQCIKKIGEQFIINYDIPALIHKNSKNTDIAVMVFRCKQPYDKIKSLVVDMHKALCVAGILSPQFDPSRAFHWSKGPFEQVLDGISYLYPVKSIGLKLGDLTFAKWLLEQGVNVDELGCLLMNPIVEIEDPDGRIREENFLFSTQYLSFEEALAKFKSVIQRVEMIHHGPLIQSISSAYRGALI